MRPINICATRLLFFAAFFFAQTFLFSQSIGNSVSVVAVDGKTYTGIIKKIEGDNYQVQNDGYETLYWLKANQFTVVNPGQQKNDLIGKPVTFSGTDGKTYTGIVQEGKGNKYRIKYDGYDFEAWLTRDQFSVSTTSSTSTDSGNSQAQNTAASSTADLQALRAICDFGYQKGWSSPVFATKFKNYLNDHSAKELRALLNFLQKATTSSARFFALKSLITGDNEDVVQKFIAQLNQYPEAYQQENCVATNRRSVIQQWQYSCSVTMIQTFLADLSPRYAWEIKQIANFDVATNDPNCPMAQQQKQLMEKYGAVPTPRGDVSGKSIGIIEPLRELITPILGVNFYAQEVTEPLPQIFSKVRAQLDNGINVPLLVGFVGTQARHFILAMRYRKVGNGYQYLIYDPWDGKCDYVSESTILNGSLAPLLSEFRITVDYYYPVS
jgi:small nuclear ribonucleoprotein (snRNP)-like protein